MSPGAHEDTIPVELEQTCAQEPIHLLGTVQAYGFMMVVDLASRRIVQVSAGIVRHWPGLRDAHALLNRPLCEWVAADEGATPPDIASLPTTHLAVRPWRPRFERTGPGRRRDWNCGTITATRTARPMR